MQTSFKVGTKKQMGKQAMALRHQQQSQNVSIRDVVDVSGDGRGGGGAAIAMGANKQVQL